MRRGHFILSSTSPPSFVGQGGVAQSADRAGSIDIPTHNSGDFALLFRLGWGAALDSAFATPSGYSLINTSLTTTNGLKVSKFYKVLSTETTVTLPATVSASDGSVNAAVIVVYRNITGYSAISGSTVNSTSSTTASYPALSAITNPILSMFFGFVTSVPGAGSPPGGRTDRGSGYISTASGYFPWSTSDILNPTTTAVSGTQSIGATTSGQVTENYALVKA